MNTSGGAGGAKNKQGGDFTQMGAYGSYNGYFPTNAPSFQTFGVGAAMGTLAAPGMGQVPTGTSNGSNANSGNNQGHNNRNNANSGGAYGNNFARWNN